MLLELVRIGVDCDTLRVCPLSEVGRGGTIGCGVFRVSPEPVRKGFEPCDIMEDRKFVEPHAFVTSTNNVTCTIMTRIHHVYTGINFTVDIPPPIIKYIRKV